MSTTQNIDIGLLDAPLAAHRLSMDEGDLITLADSIRVNGLINPIVVKPNGHRYEIIAGHRRFLAHQILKAASVPATILDAPEAAHAEGIKFAENFERSDLTPIEEANAIFAQMHELKMNLHQIANCVRRSVPWVEGRLALLDLPDDLGPLVHTRALSIASAKELAKCDDDEHRQTLTNYCINSGASANTILSWVESWKHDRLMHPGTPPTLPMPAAFGERPTIQLPCFGCRQPHDYSSMAIARFCQQCYSEVQQ